jgi:hypothetical protein
MASKFRHGTYDRKVTGQLADRHSLEALPKVADAILKEDSRHGTVFKDKFKFHGGGYPKRLEQHPKWRTKTYTDAINDPMYNSEQAARERRDQFMPSEHCFAERTKGGAIGDDTWMTRTAILQQEKRRNLQSLRRTVSENQFSYDKVMERCLGAANNSAYEFWPRFSKYHYWGGLNGTAVRNRFLAGSHEEKDFLRVARGYDDEMLGQYLPQS